MVTTRPRRDDPIFRHAAAPCDSCNGRRTERHFNPRTGDAWTDVCWLCHGTGTTDLHKPEAPNYD